MHVASQGTREDAGLHEGQERDGHFVLRQGMGDLLLLAFLPGSDDLATPSVIEHDRAALTLVEILCVDLTAIDQGKRQPIPEDRSELLLEIQRKRGATGTHRMQEAELGIQPDRLGG